MARKHNSGGEHQEENVERWLLTYADMITLLMAFFIMMFAMSQVDKAKFSAMADSVRRQLGVAAVMSASEGKVNLTAMPGDGSGITDGFSSLVSEMVAREVRDSPMSKLVSLENTPAGLVVHVQVTSALFAAGRADITDELAALLTRVATVLARIPNSVRVEGHTCNLPVHNGRFADNWELSAARAVNVVLYFVRTCHLPPGRFTAAGLADTHPLLPNDSEENRRGNRRIDIVIVKGAPPTVPADNLAASVGPALGVGPAISPPLRAATR
jgi:chemotaxis protein MotB